MNIVGQSAGSEKKRNRKKPELQTASFVTVSSADTDGRHKEHGRDQNHRDIVKISEVADHSSVVQDDAVFDGAHRKKHQHEHAGVENVSLRPGGQKAHANRLQPEEDQSGEETVVRGEHQYIEALGGRPREKVAAAGSKQQADEENGVLLLSISRHTAASFFGKCLPAANRKVHIKAAEILL